jgi:hypothetical protein
MSIQLQGIDNPQEMQVVVAGPNQANRMLIYTGTAICSFPGNGGAWIRDSLSFKIGRALGQGQFHSAIATASLAAISSLPPPPGTIDANAWALDSVDADWDDESGQVQVIAHLAVLSFAAIFRVAYQVTVLTEQ